jgi:hypothetical protein
MYQNDVPSIGTFFVVFCPRGCQKRVRYLLYASLDAIQRSTCTYCAMCALEVVEK